MQLEELFFFVFFEGPFGTVDSKSIYLPIPININIICLSCGECIKYNIYIYKYTT